MVREHQTSSGNKKETDITFTIKSDDLSKTLKLIKQNKKIKYRDLIVNKNVSKVSIIGVGMITTPGGVGNNYGYSFKLNLNIWFCWLYRQCAKSNGYNYTYFNYYFSSSWLRTSI